MERIISHARLPLPLNLQSVQSQVKALTLPWSAHFNTMHYEGEWNVLSLRAPGGDSKSILADALNNEAYLDTELMAACPAVKSLVDSLQCPVLSVRLLNLKSGAIIKPHRDHELAFEKGEARLHFPVFTNDKVEFYLEDERVHMQEGDCWYINANLMHRVANHGANDRIHLVIDCQVNDWLKSIFEQGEKHYANDAATRVQLLQVIAELRKQQTKIADKLALELEQGLN
jgi:mannose-6-phosphate isomerase-like protein (cupin superfamily)